MEIHSTKAELNSDSQRIKFIKDWLQEKKLSVPAVHIVLGSGFAAALTADDSQKLFSSWTFEGEIPFKDLVGINPSTAPGHKGSFRYYQHKESKKVICFQTGRLHGYEGNSPQAVVKPVTTAFDVGTKNFLITNAAGSLQNHMKAGSVMIITDQFNFTGLNPLTGHNDESKGPRFPDMSQIYDPEVNTKLNRNLKAENLVTHEGIYIGVNGPSFESPAETQLFSHWGMGSVGMSTVFEGIALKHRGARIGALSFLANMGAGIGDKAGSTLTGEEVLEEGLKKAPMILRALFKTAEEI